MTNLVKIRGMGAVSSCGIGGERLAADLRAGKSNGQRLTTFPIYFSNEIKVNQLQAALPEDGQGRTDEAINLAVNEALIEAGLALGGEGLRSSALILGSTGFIYESESLYRRQKALGQALPPPLSGRSVGRVAAGIAKRHALKGPVLTVTTACTSSANALLLAASMIKRGDVKRAIVIGAEMLNAFTLNGFYSLMLLSPEGIKPFDAGRRGLQLGEAAAVIILEAADSMDAAGIYLSGGANNCDTHNVISTSRDGRLVAEVMKTAMNAAGVFAADIAAIKAHGTGSLDNDSTEASAMRLVFEEGGKGEKGSAKVPPFTGLKGCMGHTLGACGAVETVAFFKCLKEGFIPSAMGFKDVDPGIGLSPLTTARMMDNASGFYMLNFFGFGGNNTSLVFRYV
ncbi:MAG: hypothetical protein HY884_06060 [Deltaproteobacteria bacterium]|nr:hypothetical protein [Deltaproteobacteria bacterium]